MVVVVVVIVLVVGGGADFGRNRVVEEADPLPEAVLSPHRGGCSHPLASKAPEGAVSRCVYLSTSAHNEARAQGQIRGLNWQEWQGLFWCLD